MKWKGRLGVVGVGLLDSIVKLREICGMKVEYGYQEDIYFIYYLNLVILGLIFMDYIKDFLKNQVH